MVRDSWEGGTVPHIQRLAVQAGRRSLGDEVRRGHRYEPKPPHRAEWLTSSDRRAREQGGEWDVSLAHRHRWPRTLSRTGRGAGTPQPAPLSSSPRATSPGGEGLSLHAGGGRQRIARRGSGGTKRSGEATASGLSRRVRWGATHSDVARISRGAISHGPRAAPRRRAAAGAVADARARPPWDRAGPRSTRLARARAAENRRRQSGWGPGAPAFAPGPYPQSGGWPVAKPGLPHALSDAEDVLDLHSRCRLSAHGGAPVGAMPRRVRRYPLSGPCSEISGPPSGAPAAVKPDRGMGGSRWGKGRRPG